MKRAIATVCLSGSLPDKLEAAAAAGFEGVEIFESDLLTFEGSPSEAGAMARDLGLEISLFQPFRDFEAMPSPLRARNMDRAERKFDTMAALGAGLILVCSNTQATCIDDPARAAGPSDDIAKEAFMTAWARASSAAVGPLDARSSQIEAVIRATSAPSSGAHPA